MTTATAPIVRIGRFHTAIHKPDRGRPCVHALEPPPKTLLLDRGAVERLNRQARVITHEPPIIAARLGDTLLLGVDVLGPLTGRHPKRDRTDDQRTRHQWRYTLHPVPDEPDRLLAVRIDPPAHRKGSHTA